MRRAVALLLPVLLLGLAGCTPTPGEAYLSTVREGLPELADTSDADLTDLGESVCGVFDRMGFEDGMIEFISQAKSVGIDAAGAGTIAGAATGAYCPAYSDNF